MISAALVCLSLFLLGGMTLVRYEPSFYRERSVVVAPGIENAGPDHRGMGLEVLSRRAMTKASGWYAAISRPGGWETALTADELNAWLAVDLPRNHPGWLPRGVTQPRLLLRPRHVILGTRLECGPLTAVAWFDMEVVLRDVNHLAITVDQAGLGAIPLPRTPVIRELARRLGSVGMVTELRMLDGRMVLMVYIPSSHDGGATSSRLEALTIGDGELLMAGETRPLAELATPPTSPES